MAFDINKLQKSTQGDAIEVNRLWMYTSENETMATIVASGYFNNVNGGNPYPTLVVDDLIYIVASDGANFVSVTAISPAVTVAAFSVNIPAGSITNSDIAANAAIAFSKLAALPSTEVLVGSAGNVATAVAMTGDVTISNTGVTAIAAGAVVNADVNAAAAIAFSKLAALPSAEVLVGSAGNVATAVAVTGDVTIDNAGVTAIGAGKVLSSMLSPLVIQYANVLVSAAEFNGMYAAPKLLVAAGGANTEHRVFAVEFEVDYGGAQFASGGDLAVQYDSTANGAGVLASAALADSVAQGWAADSTAGVAGASVSGAASAKVNKGLYLSNISGAFTTGTSDVRVHIWYATITTAL